MLERRKKRKKRIDMPSRGGKDHILVMQDDLTVSEQDNSALGAVDLELEESQSISMTETDVNAQPIKDSLSQSSKLSAPTISSSETDILVEIVSL
jgi:hypothetical protein